ncbi:MAG: glyoxalase [Rhizobiales bacterium]|nr:glyoxalase [Hyphomicrobiales bacterium]
MRFERTGVILCTENYVECVAFYQNALQLPVLETLDNEHSKLTTFKFGSDTDLMIEMGGTAIPDGKTLADNPVWLRFNVADVDEAAADLKTRGISVNIRREVWGTVGDFMDPDGNICSLREETPGRTG